LVSVIFALTEAEPVWFLYAAFFIGIMVWTGEPNRPIVRACPTPKPHRLQSFQRLQHRRA
jgi:hypothetical protein